MVRIVERRFRSVRVGPFNVPITFIQDVSFPGVTLQTGSYSGCSG